MIGPRASRRCRASRPTTSARTAHHVATRTTATPRQRRRARPCPSSASSPSSSSTSTSERVRPGLHAPQWPAMAAAGSLREPHHVRQTPFRKTRNTPRRRPQSRRRSVATGESAAARAQPADKRTSVRVASTGATPRPRRRPGTCHSPQRYPEVLLVPRGLGSALEERAAVDASAARLVPGTRWKFCAVYRDHLQRRH